MYEVEIDTDEEFDNDDDISMFVQDYLNNNDIEEIGDGGSFEIIDYGD
jgi:hypothetical protein